MGEDGEISFASTSVRQFGNRLLPNCAIRDGLHLTAARNKIAWQRYPLIVQQAVAQFATINETVRILNGIDE